MGGWGSGRHYGSGSTTDDYIRLDVRYLQREGLLDWRSQFNLRWLRNGKPLSNIDILPEGDRVILSYTVGASSEKPLSYHYEVFLERSPCHYGGVRIWFRCPARGCGRRVAILYGGKVFACRQCYGLAYESQRESPGQRADTRAWAIRKRCGDWGCLFDPVFRPKGMHHRTFRRLEAEYERATGVSKSEIMRRLGGASLSDIGLDF